MAVFRLLLLFCILWYGRYPLLFRYQAYTNPLLLVTLIFLDVVCIIRHYNFLHVCVKITGKWWQKWRKTVSRERSNNRRRKWNTSLNVSDPCLVLSTSFSGYLVALLDAFDTSSDEQGRVVAVTIILPFFCNFFLSSFGISGTYYASLLWTSVYVVAGNWYHNKST